MHRLFIFNSKKILKSFGIRDEANPQEHARAPSAAAHLESNESLSPLGGPLYSRRKLKYSAYAAESGKSPKNYETVFPELFSSRRVFRSEKATRARHASRRPEIYEPSTTSLEHAPPRVNYFRPGTTRCTSQCCVSIYVYGSRKVSYRPRVLARRDNLLTVPNCY